MQRALLALVALVGWTSSAAAAEPVQWMLASITPEGSPQEADIHDLSRSLEEATGGRVRVRTRLGGVVADELTTLELCKQGRVQVWVGSVGAVAATIPAVSIFEAPYLFDDVAAFDRATRGDLLRRPGVLKAFHAQGLEPIGVAFVGWREMGSVSRPLRVPADLKGLRARSQPVPLHRAMWKLLGAIPHELALGDMKGAFEAKQVDVSDVPPLYVYATSISSHLKFLTRTDHMTQAGLVLISRDAFAKLPKRTQQAIHALRVEKASRFTRSSQRFEEEMLELLRKQGVGVITPTPVERAAWRKALAPLRSEAVRLSGPAGADLLKAIEQK